VELKQADSLKFADLADLCVYWCWALSSLSFKSECVFQATWATQLSLARSQQKEVPPTWYCESSLVCLHSNDNIFCLFSHSTRVTAEHTRRAFLYLWRPSFSTSLCSAFNSSLPLNLTPQGRFLDKLSSLAFLQWRCLHLQQDSWFKNTIIICPRDLAADVGFCL
jgi:hypothetical protein